MRIRKLGENLYLVEINWWKWSAIKELARALRKLQEEGKVVTAISKQGYSYLVCTMGKV